MAVRVRLEISAPGGRRIETNGVLNGGFEVPEPHLLLPAACAERLLPDFGSRGEAQVLEAADGLAEFLAAEETLAVRVVTPDRKGPEATLHVLIAEAASEVLVSDAGIDALGLRIESFVPGRWRFADETRSRETEPPARWAPRRSGD